jgi:hypothetical protein
LKNQRSGSEGDTSQRKVSDQFALAVWQDYFHHQRQASADSQNQLGDDQLKIDEVE